jgi:hypothetical protein
MFALTFLRRSGFSIGRDLSSVALYNTTDRGQAFLICPVNAVFAGADRFHTRFGYDAQKFLLVYLPGC